MTKHWPEAEQGRIATKNQMGFMFTELSGVSPKFIKACKDHHDKVVDIGCAYGVVTLPSLKHTDAKVIAFDLSDEHLKILKESAPTEKLSQLQTVQGKFPDGIEFEDNSIDAMHSCFVFHFISGKDTERAFNKIFKALKPGGKFYLNTASVYLVFIKSILSDYEEKAAKGDRWPGEITNLKPFVPESDLPHAPDFFNVYKIEQLQQELQRAGFEIDESFYYDVEQPKLLASDGKGLIGIIASKPV